jgi:hypothetical protein
MPFVPRDEPTVRSAKGRAKVKGDKDGRFGILARPHQAALSAASCTSEERSLGCARDDGALE